MRSPAALLLDPDADQQQIVRPVHTRPGHIVIVASGAFFGTLARYGAGLLLPASKDSWPAAIFMVNILGAFLLGLLLQILKNHGPDESWRRLVRLGLGTGFLGAFTTYSSLAVGVDTLVNNGHIILAGAYALGSLFGGLVACVLGIQLATRSHRRRYHRHGGGTK
ncbi:MAG TPA: CrcB family protein [Patescibacteria group bacterium]|nr:CrcB family protein [Patescibacteria group bacterium]